VLTFVQGKRAFVKDMAQYWIPPNEKPATIAPSLVNYKRGVGTDTTALSPVTTATIDIHYLQFDPASCENEACYTAQKSANKTKRIRHLIIVKAEHSIRIDFLQTAVDLDLRLGIMKIEMAIMLCALYRWHEGPFYKTFKFASQS
jgi:hypothetical protein